MTINNNKNVSDERFSCTTTGGISSIRTSKPPKPHHIGFGHNLRMLQPRTKRTDISVGALERSFERIEHNPICTIANGVYILGGKGPAMSGTL